MGLHALPAEERHGLLFVHPNPDGVIDLDDLLDEMFNDDFPTRKLGGLVPLTRDAYDTACNWKLAMDTFGEMRHQPDSEWDITIAGLPVYWIFPNVILMPFRFGCFLVRAYPSPGEPGRYTTITTPTPESSDVRSLRC